MENLQLSHKVGKIRRSPFVRSVLRRQAGGRAFRNACLHCAPRCSPDLLRHRKEGVQRVSVDGACIISPVTLNYECGIIE